MARARAMTQVIGIDPVFIELASEHLHGWELDKTSFPGSFMTLMEGHYRDCPAQELSRRLLQQLKHLKPDAVAISGYSERPMRAAARWAKANGKASILFFETTEWDHPRRWWKELPKRFLVSRYYDAGFVGGKSHRQYLERLGMPAARIWEGYDVVDNAYFAERCADLQPELPVYRMRFGLPDRYFLYVGRFSPEKNIIRLLEAYALYRQECPAPWGLVLVGDGPQGGELKQRATNLGLSNVIWPGFIQVEELPVYYALSSAFILPSTVEPWGLVVNEAMSCGLPILASDRCGCTADLVGEGWNGSVFNPYEVTEIVAAMNLMSGVNDGQRALLGHRSRKIIASYTPQAWAENLSECVRRTTVRLYRKPVGVP